MSTYPLSLDYYLGLVAPEHNQKPKFMETVAAEVQPFVDLQKTLYSMIGLFNPDTAVGDQLDKVAVWVGVSRQLTTPLQDVWFSLDEVDLGLDQGTLFGPGDSLAGLTILPDDSFLILIKLAIAMNHWDGTIPGAYTLWNSIFAAEGWQIGIQDYQDMTMAILFINGISSIVAQAIVTNGYFNLRPAGVRIVGFFQPSIPNMPVFGLDIENSLISGPDVGAFPTELFD